MSANLMSEALIAPDKAQSALPATIATWEATQGRTLPAAYKTFLTTYNGGRIYPLIFDVRRPPEAWSLSDYATFIDLLYDWDYAINQWNQQTYSDGTPLDMFLSAAIPVV